MQYTGCRGCNRFRINATCEAFPKGIPLAILSGDVEHTQIVKGQTGYATWVPLLLDTKRERERQARRG